jgi:hypothetical protein
MQRSARTRLDVRRAPHRQHVGLRVQHALNVPRQSLKSVALLLEVAVAVVDASNAAYDVAKGALRMVGGNAGLRHQGPRRPPQVMNCPSRKRDLVRIVAPLYCSLSQLIEHERVELPPEFGETAHEGFAGGGEYNSFFGRDRVVLVAAFGHPLTKFGEQRCCR